MKNDKKNNKIHLYALIIIFVLSCILMIGYDIYIVKNYEPVQATVNVKKLSSKKGRKRITCIYTYNDKEYTCIMSRKFPLVMKNGETITVYINKNNPGKCMYPDFVGDVGLILFSVLLIILAKKAMEKNMIKKE